MALFSQRPNRWKDPSEGVARLRISKGPVYVPNDEPAGAIELASGGGTVSGTVLGATFSPTTEGILNNGRAGVWYRWTAPRDTNLWITERHLEEGVLGLYSIDEEGNPETLLSGRALSTPDSVYDLDAEIRYNAKSNTSYLIMIAHPQARNRSLVHELAWTISETNDFFHNATVIDGDEGVVPLNMQYAGIEQGETSYQGFTTPRSVWYRYKPTTRGFYDLNVRRSRYASGFASLDVYEIVENGPTLSESSVIHISRSTSWGFDGILRADPLLFEPERSYAIAICDSYLRNDGFLTQFEYSLAIPVADRFEDATELHGTSGSITGALNWTTVEKNERVPYFSNEHFEGSPPPGLGTAWYQFVVTETGRWKFSFPSEQADYYSAGPLLLQVFKGVSHENLDLLYTGRGKQYYVKYDASTFLLEGERVWIQLSAPTVGKGSPNSSATNPLKYVLTWGLETEPMAPNDNYRDAEELFGDEGTIAITSHAISPEYFVRDWMTRQNSGSSIWYKWRTDRDGMLAVYACNLSSSGFGTPGVYVGDDILSALPALIPYRDADLTKGFDSRFLCGTSDSGTYIGLYPVPVKAGVTYRICMMTSGYAPGAPGNLNWKFFPNIEPAYPSEWHFAEGASSSDLDTYYAIANPHDESIEVDMLFMPEQGDPFTRSITVGPKARATEQLAALFESRGLTGGAGARFLERKRRGFGVERTVYAIHPEKRFFHGGHTAMGANETRREWVMPEGSLGTAGPDGTPFQTFILLANPSPDQVTVELEHAPENAPKVRRSVFLPPWKRVTVEPKTTDGLPPWGFMTIARGDRPFVAERVTWWSEDGPNGRHFSEATASGPPPAAAPLAHLAPFGFATYRVRDRFFLFGNPTAAETVLGLSRSGGNPLWRELPIPSQQRLTLDQYSSPESLILWESVYSRSVSPLVLEVATYQPSTDRRNFRTGGSRHPSGMASRRWMIPNIRYANESGFQQRFHLNVTPRSPTVPAAEARFYDLEGSSDSFVVRLSNYYTTRNLPTSPWTSSFPLYRPYGSTISTHKEIFRTGWIEVLAPEPIILNYTSEILHLRDDGTAELVGEFTGTAVPSAPLIPIELPMETAPATFEFTLGGEEQSQQMLLPTPTVTPTPVPMMRPGN